LKFVCKAILRPNFYLFPFKNEKPVQTWFSEHSCSHSDLVEQVRDLLKKKIKEGEQQAPFLLGQLYFEEGWHKEAFLEFEKIKDQDSQALYQLGVMYFDGLGINEDHEKGMECMMKIAGSCNPKDKHLKYVALYNLGRAYFEGYGTYHSDEEAESKRLWLLAADDGNPKASIKAQTALGMFYSRPDTKDLNKAFFWHSEACGNGSLESQGAMGVMYLYGLGIRQDLASAFQCLKEAAERGNMYAQGHLVIYYYKKKMFTKAAQLAKKIAQCEDVTAVAKNTDCLLRYVAKGAAYGCFYYARCLQLGLGTEQDIKEAKKYYLKTCCRINYEGIGRLHALYLPYND
uniref:LRP2-binding protein n=1 Tax=Latimeria chalumnae TaxID=7897 RepID=H3A6H1_LATCH